MTENNEPNWEGKEIDYNCTLLYMAHQLDIPLWKAMTMMKYAKSKVCEECGCPKREKLDSDSCWCDIVIEMKKKQ